VDAGKTTTTPVADAAPVTRYRLDQRWQDAVQSFETAQSVEGMAPATIAQRVKHVTRLAAEAPSGPWQLTREELHDWLDSLTCSDLTRRSHRSSVAAFYRWATRAGRIRED